MSHRVVRGLLCATWLSARPSCIPKSRPRGAKAVGLRYERALAKAIPFGKHGVWFSFSDYNGLGYCQPDVIIELDSHIVVLECKYTWVPEGHTQIAQLYAPVLEKALGKPVVGIVVCRRLVPRCQASIFGSLQEALGSAMNGNLTVLHWLGSSVLAIKSPSPSSRVSTPIPIAPHHEMV